MRRLWRVGIVQLVSFENIVSGSLKVKEVGPVNIDELEVKWTRRPGCLNVLMLAW